MRKDGWEDDLVQFDTLDSVNKHEKKLEREVDFVIVKKWLDGLVARERSLQLHMTTLRQTNALEPSCRSTESFAIWRCSGKHGAGAHSPRHHRASLRRRRRSESGHCGTES